MKSFKLQFKHSRAQAALEFLTTYGWAFLVILVMIGALSYFGVLDPSRFLPDKCVFGAGIGACVDSVADDSTDQIQAFVINSLGKDIAVNSVNVTVQGTTTACVTTNNGCDGLGAGKCGLPATWSNNEKAEIVIQCGAGNLAAGDKPKAHVVINYKEVGGSYNHTIEGDIQVKLSP